MLLKLDTVETDLRSFNFSRLLTIKNNISGNQEDAPREAKKFSMSLSSEVTESILTSCIRVWFGSTAVADRICLQRVVKTKLRITGTTLPSLQSIYHRRACRNPHMCDMNGLQFCPHVARTGGRTARF